MTDAIESATQSPSRPRRKRLFAIVAGGLLLIGGALAYLELFHARPIGEGPAGPAVDRTPFTKPWSDRQVVLVGIGDSVTAGFGASRVDRSYFNRLITNPPDEFADIEGACLSAVLPNLKSLNLAISGSTSLDHETVVRERLPVQDANVFGLVVISTGGNDLIHNYGRSAPREGAMYGATLVQADPWIANFAKRLDNILTMIDERFPGGCEIYLADIYDPTDGVGDAPSVFLPEWSWGLVIHALYNDTIHDVAERRKNVHIVPLYETFLGHGSHCRQFWRATYDSADPHYWYHTNIEDPNDRGYDAIRRIFLTAIAENSILAPK